ncbi:MAG: fusion protein [Dysgonomonas sp.]
MAKQFLLFAGKEIDTDTQTVSVNQIVQLEGYNYPKYVVYEIKKDQWGVHYKLINLRDFSFDTSDTIRPLSERFGIGIYYDDKNPTFKTNEEVAELLVKAKALQDAEQAKERQESERRDTVKEIGRKWLQENLPEDTQALIIACLKEDESDMQTDYYASRTTRTVILGFSKHTRDIFSEMRKCASNFEETAYLSEYNEGYEHREKYSMGKGYYLGESHYSGWIIKKESIANKEQAIGYYSYIAGCPDSIFIKPSIEQRQSATAENEQVTIQIESDNLSFEIVDYSEKAIALFGDTKEIKDLLKAMGGKFNPRLAHNNEKKAGWIFSKTKRVELNTVLNLNN